VKFRSLAAALMAVALAVGSAHAASVRVTQADAKAALRTIVTDSENPAVIKPLSGSPWDGRHYCALDWHTVVIAILEGGDATFTKKDAAAIFSAISISFVLNGVPLASERTNIKAYPDPSQLGFVEVYYVQQGRVLSPSDLAVGQHALSMTITTPTSTEVSTITFFIDAAGTGACL
jgi:hypothetical protein